MPLDERRHLQITTQFQQARAFAAHRHKLDRFQNPPPVLLQIACRVWVFGKKSLHVIQGFIVIQFDRLRLRELKPVRL